MEDKNYKASNENPYCTDRFLSLKELLDGLELLKDFDVSRIKSIAQNWPKAVGVQLAARSYPYDLAGDKLFVSADGRMVLAQLNRMRGNITRALKVYCGIEVKKISFIQGNPPRDIRAPMRRRKPMPKPYVIDEEEVKEIKARSPEGLPDEASEAFARLEVLLKRRTAK